MSRLEGSKFLPTGKRVLREDYEVDPRSKSSGTPSASGLGLCGGPAGALKGFQGTCRPRSWTDTPKRDKCTAGEHMREMPARRAGGGGNGGVGSGSPSCGGGRRETASAGCWCSLVIQAGRDWGISIAALHPGFCLILAATPIPEPCSHAASTGVLLSTAVDTALHIRVSGTPECQHQWGSALVPPNTNLGRLDPCPLWAQPPPRISKPVAGVIPDPRPERGLW